jgi:nucleoside-diphosphate-sugar epimerase
MSERVLVTGGSGYLGSHCIVSLLRQGHAVRTTVRSSAKADEVRRLVRRGGQDPDTLEVAVADLTSDGGWSEAVAGCSRVLHVASPFPLGVPKDPNELIVPAREGTVRVLRAAADAGVARVVVTSSFAAVGYGHPAMGRPFTEEDWTELDGPRPVAPYPRSKTIAERAAWDFAAQHPRLELAVVNPVGILGPPLGTDIGTSVAMVSRLLDGMPGVPDVRMGLVDVRDVADLHVLAMTHPEAAGERFLAVCGRFVTFAEVAQILRTELGERARKVPTRVLPHWVVRLVGRFDPGVGQLATELGLDRDATSAKAMAVLGWSPRPLSVTLVDTAAALPASR